MLFGVWPSPTSEIVKHGEYLSPVADIVIP